MRPSAQALASWDGALLSNALWRLGQVIDSVQELPSALARARELQPRFEQAQNAMSAASIDQSEVPASERQAQAILDFALTAHA